MTFRALKDPAKTFPARSVSFLPPLAVSRPPHHGFRSRQLSTPVVPAFASPVDMGTTCGDLNVVPANPDPPQSPLRLARLRRRISRSALSAEVR